jgi:hypothetical protein
MAQTEVHLLEEMAVIMAAAAAEKELLGRLGLVEVEQFALFGPVQRASSHQPTRQTFKE